MIRVYCIFRPSGNQGGEVDGCAVAPGKAKAAFDSLNSPSARHRGANQRQRKSAAESMTSLASGDKA